MYLARVLLVFSVVVFGSNEGFAATESAAFARGDFSYDVRFTNPECKTYRYRRGIENRAGDKVLREKPKNVYCKQGDQRASERQ